MKNVTFVVLYLFAVLPAHAASVDCRKARTEFEKAVCHDKELSRLDEEVETAYKAALKDKEHAELVRQDHASWLQWRGDERSACYEKETVPVCAKNSYLGHLSWLRLPFLRATPAGQLPTPPWNNSGRGEPVESATLLKDGRVLLLTNVNAYLYDPASRQFSVPAPPVKGRWGALTLLLHDGRVLVAGGYRPDDSATDRPPIPIEGAELYDPATRRLASLGHGPDCGSVALLPNDKILVSGGCTPPSGYAGPHPMYLRDASLYDPASGKPVATGKLVTARANHSATLLKDGKVLIVGGTLGEMPVPAELYDPATGNFSATGTPLKNRGSHAAILLPNGKVLVVGGRHSSENWGPYYHSLDTLGSAELYDPATGRFSATGSPFTITPGRSLMLLPDGKVLVVGQDVDLLSLERYDPETGKFSLIGKFNANFESAILLNDGKLLLALGGAVGFYDPTDGKK